MSNSNQLLGTIRTRQKAGREGGREGEKSKQRRTAEQIEYVTVDFKAFASHYI